MRAFHRPFTARSPQSAGIYLFLLMAITLGSSCRSVLPQQDSDSARGRIPQAAIPKDPERGCTPAEFNALLDHVRTVRKAALEQECYKHAAEWEAACAYRRVQQLESSLIPGRLVPGSACELEKPKCLEEYR